MYSYTCNKRVRYAETDKMGYLYYGHYAKYYEIGRVESLRALGLSYKQMEDNHKVMLPVISLESRYLKPAYYDENIEIHSIINTPPDKMITFEHKLFNESRQLVNKAVVKLFFVDMLTGKRVSCPSMLKSALQEYF